MFEFDFGKFGLAHFYLEEYYYYERGNGRWTRDIQRIAVKTWTLGYKERESHHVER